jgi:enolase
MNIINSGAHATTVWIFRNLWWSPWGPPHREGLRYEAETVHALKGLLKARNLATAVGDEGGFAPNLHSIEATMEVIIQAIEKGGYKPGQYIAIALDSAASSFAGDKPGLYDLRSPGPAKKPATK